VTSKNISNTLVISDIKCNKDKLVRGSLHGKSRFKFKSYFPRTTIKRGNRCFENVEQFRYLGTIITNRNLIQ
jgi:hypothetical protein